MGHGCYNGGIETRITTEPPGARVWLLTEFDYKLCQHRGIDPWDLSDCRWREETGKVISVVSGDYRVWADWGNGATTSSRRSFVDAAESGGTVVIRP
jgi:hypothetical protein